jgi:hypothetical protein
MVVQRWENTANQRVTCGQATTFRLWSTLTSTNSSQDLTRCMVCGARQSKESNRPRTDTTITWGNCDVFIGPGSTRFRLNPCFLCRWVRKIKFLKKIEKGHHTLVETTTAPASYNYTKYVYANFMYFATQELWFCCNMQTDLNMQIGPPNLYSTTISTSSTRTWYFDECRNLR